MPNTLVRTVDRWAFEKPLAAVLGVAAAFATLTAPLPWPLGARIATALLAAVGLGVVAFVAMRRPKPPVARAEVQEAEEASVFAPGELPLRLRRADRHPDAPARAPIFASRDLGSPFMDVGAFAAPPEGEPVPEAEFAEVSDDAGPAPADAAADAAEPVGAAAEPAADDAAPAFESASDHPVVDAEPEPEPVADQHEPVLQANPAPLPEPAAEDEEPTRHVAPLPLPEPEEAVTAGPLDAFRPAEGPAPAPARAARPSLDAMMQRLTLGLERRGGAARDLPAVLAEALDARHGRTELREALEELNRLAGRRH